MPMTYNPHVDKAYLNNPKAELTEAQEQAIRRIYDRGPLNQYGETLVENAVDPNKSTVMEYETFRQSVYNSFIGCAMVYWQRMWLGVEPDGYTHS